MNARLSQQHKAFFLSVALGCFEEVKESEEPGSVRYRRMEAALKEVCRCIDIYRPEAWDFDELNKASALLNGVNAQIREFLPDCLPYQLMERE